MLHNIMSRNSYEQIQNVVTVTSKCIFVLDKGLWPKHTKTKCWNSDIKVHVPFS